MAPLMAVCKALWDVTPAIQPKNQAMQEIKDKEKEMSMYSIVNTIGMAVLLAGAAAAGPVALFSTGNPDSLIGTLSRPASGSLLETETADDFILGQNALITGATITGLVPSGTTLAALQAAEVEIELYHVFPLDSTNPPDGRVPTRTNSPADNQFAAFDKALGQLSSTATILNPA